VIVTANTISKRPALQLATPSAAEYSPKHLERFPKLRNSGGVSEHATVEGELSVAKFLVNYFKKGPDTCGYAPLPDCTLRYWGSRGRIGGLPHYPAPYHSFLPLFTALYCTVCRMANVWTFSLLENVCWNRLLLRDEIRCSKIGVIIWVSDTESGYQDLQCIFWLPH